MYPQSYAEAELDRRLMDLESRQRTNARRIKDLEYDIRALQTKIQQLKEKCDELHTDIR